MANPNIDAIKGYVEQSKKGLIGKIFNASESVQHFYKMDGVKGATQLTLLDTAVKFQDGTNCGWNPQGTDTFTKRVLTPGLVAIQKSWCPDTLFNTWMNTALNYAAEGTEITDADIIETIIGQQTTEASKELENKVWNGKVASGDLFDGLVTILNAENSVVKSEYAQGATITSIVDAMIAKVPEDAYSMGEVVLYMGKDSYRKYLQELRANGNLVLNLGVDDLKAPESVIAPLSDVRVIGVRGLNGTGLFYASYANNFIYGTDMVRSAEKTSFKYIDADETYHFNMRFVAGVQVAFPSLVVVGKEQA